MRLKIIILILAVLAFLSVSIGSALYYYSFRTAAFEKNQADAAARLNLLSDQLSTHLSEHIKSVKALSGIRELRYALLNTSLETLYQANQILDLFTASLDLEVSYLIDSSGVTLCSSNRNEKDSFVGHDFSFRPYFQAARNATAATYLALGSTSNVRGVYYAHPVFDGQTGTVIGVAVMKAAVEPVEKRLFSGYEDVLMFVSPEGMIFISNQTERVFKLLWEITEEEADRLVDSRQFGNGPWEWSGFFKKDQTNVIDADNEKYLIAQREVTHYPGWKIISLRKHKDIERLVSEPFARILGPVILLILILVSVLILMLYRLGIQEIAQRKKAEKELRLSEERYRHIYHKTPVMLHSIDTQGWIIRVSDHWLDVMGYDRDAVIGRQLTDFFTPESRQYAHDVIFPEFFKTGFCKDIAYTYVKRNGECLDIMLSCYGVRDEDGQIIRSLAVSVDVTEKNRAQKDLQIATEKLSQYSHDLEQQVHKRTAQLEASREHLKKMSKNIIASQEREKAQVARELHDHLGQVLTALRIDAVWVEQTLTRQDQAAGERARKMRLLIEDTINDVRDMAYRLRPRVLDDLGLADALESLLSDFERRSNVSCVFKHEPVFGIDDTLSTALYRIGQEAVTNALRHSGATSIVVELIPDEKGIVLTIEDNGCGFDTRKSETVNGFGLEGMKERASLVGGKLDISSLPSRGTRICCKVKIKG